MNHASSKPLITVIIPTRERADTLLFAIKTALDQDSDSYEVIVSDNFSQDNTKDVVQSFNDRRLVYINTGRRLSMCDNWDFALERARGEYVIFIGDDDAIMPGAIDKLQTFIQNNPSLVYCWTKTVYIWPIGGQPAYIRHLAPDKCPSDIDLARLAKFSVLVGGMVTPPTFYHSAVAKRVSDMIREQTGRVFHSTIPDSFTAFAIPVFAGKVIDVGFTVTVSGESQKANSAIRHGKDGIAVVEKFMQEYGDYKMHPSLCLGIVPPYVLCMADTPLVAMDKFPQFYSDMQFNYDIRWADMLRVAKLMGCKNNLRKFIQKRRQFRQNHSCSIVRVMFYYVAYKFVASFRQMLKKKRFGPSAKHVPDNISDFVKQLEGGIKGKEEWALSGSVGRKEEGKFIRFVEFIIKFLLQKRVQQ